MELLGNSLQQALEPVAGTIDLFRQLSAIVLEGDELLPQVAILVAQFAAQVRCLADLVLKRGKFSIHHCTIV